MRNNIFVHVIYRKSIPKSRVQESRVFLNHKVIVLILFALHFLLGRRARFARSFQQMTRNFNLLICP